jgi:hypothetical protein
MNTLFVVLFFLSIFILVVFAINYYSTKQTLLRALSKLNANHRMQFKSNVPIKLTGKVMPVKTPFEAPFSKRKCVAYAVKIEQKRQIGKNKHWNTLVENEMIQDFFVEYDGTPIIVKPKRDPKDYLSYLVADKKVVRGILNAPSKNFETLLEEYSLTSKNMFGLNKTMRYTERVLEIGDTVTVGGIAKWKTLDATLLGYNYSKIVTLEGNREQKLIITDLDEAIVR